MLSDLGLFEHEVHGCNEDWVTFTFWSRILVWQNKPLAKRKTLHKNASNEEVKDSSEVAHSYTTMTQKHSKKLGLAINNWLIQGRSPVTNQGKQLFACLLWNDQCVTWSKNPTKNKAIISFEARQNSNKFQISNIPSNLWKCQSV